MYPKGKECAMRNLQGKLVWVIVRTFLAATFLLALSTTICRAQCWGGPQGPLPGVTETPGGWAPGQSYVVTLTPFSITVTAK